MKVIVVSIILIVLLLFSVFILINKPQAPKNIVQVSSPTPQTEKVSIKASFTVTTGNITRSFKAEKYHNQSSNVYLENADPTVIHVKKTGITWDDFFKTLPMTLTKDCLITGDGETLCNGKNGTLKFYLNNIETPDLLAKEIKDGDKALIKFF